MKRIILCFDGTWNVPGDTPDDIETNVCRFYESVHPVDANGIRQVRWYDAGVGTEPLNTYTGGVFGALLDKHILDGYSLLVDQFEEGDEIYVVGFSRGAYTARSLVGLLRTAGLVRRRLAWVKRKAAYMLYRSGWSVDSFVAKTFRRAFSRDVKIRFVGVFDTVGALGIPLMIAQYLNSVVYQFHDTTLSSIVEHGYHAVAIDEHRQDFDVCLWDPQSKPTQVIEQRWYRGSHSDVGGGVPERFRSDMSLAWMQGRAAALGLALNKVDVAEDAHTKKITDSYVSFLGGAYARLKARHYRRFGLTRFGNEVVDESVTEKEVQFGQQA